MERGQTRPASGVLRSRAGRRSLGLVERVGGVRGFVGLFTLTLTLSHRGRGDGSDGASAAGSPSP